MASSRPIAAGEEYTPDDINNLRSDVLDATSGHKHDDADGARVPFANLDVVGAAGSTAPSGGSKSYNDIANHVAGSQHVHGLSSSAYVLGSTGQGLVVQYGYESANGTFMTRAVTFPLAFSSTPIMFVSWHVTPGGDGDWPWDAGGGYRNVTPTGFTLVAGTMRTQNEGFSGASWMAIGVVA